MQRGRSRNSADAVVRGVAAATLVAVIAGVGACTAADPDPGPATGTGTKPSPGGDATRPVESAPGSSAEGAGSGPSSAAPVTRPVVRPRDFDRDLAMAAVGRLAGDIGPRHATSPAYRRAARWVGRALRNQGYRVRRQSVDVPGGDSWGVPVPAGRSWNVVATPPGFEAGRPHLVVGAHLDTVPLAPGAEDNASGVGVLLAAADAAAQARTRLPVVWVAFGAEEPRGPTDDDHHYGSRAYVAALSDRERRAVRAMVSLDRVGVGAVVPVGSSGRTDPVQRRLLAAGRRADVPTTAESDSRSSDHWSFVRAGLPGARLGSTPYAAYHSAADTPEVVDPGQLGRTGRLLLAWLAAARP